MSFLILCLTKKTFVSMKNAGERSRKEQIHRIVVTQYVQLSQVQQSRLLIVAAVKL